MALRVLGQFENEPVYVVGSAFAGGVCVNGAALSSIGVSWTVRNSVFRDDRTVGWVDLALNVPLMSTRRAETELGWEPSADRPVVAGLDLRVRCTTVRVLFRARRRSVPAHRTPKSQECRWTSSYGSQASGPGNRRATAEQFGLRFCRYRRSTAIR